MPDTSVRRIWASWPGEFAQAVAIEVADPLLTQATMLSPPECQMPPALAMVIACATRLPLRETDADGSPSDEGWALMTEPMAETLDSPAPDPPAPRQTRPPAGMPVAAGGGGGRAGGLGGGGRGGGARARGR